jgi:hypothetical protein
VGSDSGASVGRTRFQGRYSSDLTAGQAGHPPQGRAAGNSAWTRCIAATCLRQSLQRSRRGEHMINVYGWRILPGVKNGGKACSWHIIPCSTPGFDCWQMRRIARPLAHGQRARWLADRRDTSEGSQHRAACESVQLDSILALVVPDVRMFRVHNDPQVSTSVGRLSIRCAVINAVLSPTS